MADPDPLLNAAQTAFQSLLTTADEVLAESRTAFKAAMQRESALQDKIFARLEKQISGAGEGG